ncbi:MAG TPA: DUF2341 domain-containing protein [Candidatus Eisenbacteria bacterium]|nr:DUF2341 domain-containing protein [Candidatus Eisenbacteria bacterium]
MAAARRRCLLLLGLLFLLLASVAQAQIYRRTIVVTNPTSNFFGAMPIDAPIYPGMLTGVDPNGANMWFLASDMQTLLPHFVERWDEGIGGGFKSIVWVRIPPLPANSSMTCYLMYGSPSMGSSNFEATFPTRYILESGMVTLGGVQQYYDWFEVKPGATVIVQAGSPVMIRAARARIGGTINGLGQGHPGPGGFYMSGAGPGGGAASPFRGSGGGGYGGAGGSGGSQDMTISAGGLAYGTENGGDFDLGSSGGSADVFGGAGGGAVQIMARRVDVSGTIDVRGGDGGVSGSFPQGFGGGGGSGGSILLSASRVFLGPASLRADGGRGGELVGGGGGGGRVKMHVADWFWYDEFNPPSLTVAGGESGFPVTINPPQPGSPGAYFIGNYSAVGLTNPWVSVTVGPEEATVSVETKGLRAFVGQPMPNPSSREVSFRIDTVREGACRIEILDLQGRRVRSLVDGVTSAGRRDVSWDLRDENGLAVPGGLYFANVEVEGARSTRRIVVTR